ncbi:MAG: head-tail connector protein [Rhodobacteraceae bacterium]|nr:head-tail connector protein [Paracoccaceae bacterium]
MTLRGFQSLELVTAPVNSPLVLADVKAHLVVEESDTDALITQLILAAAAHVDALGVLGRPMISQTWGQWVGPAPSEVRLLLLPVQSLSAVKYWDVDGVFQTATLADFELQTAGNWVIVKPVSGASWPSTASREAAIRIDCVVGYGDAGTDVPDDILQALLMLVAHWFENRESVTETRLMTTPYGFQELINAHRSGWYG